MGTSNDSAIELNGLNFDCDWRLGFNLDPARKGTIGYILFWSGCGGLSLSKDIEVWSPFSGSGQTVVSGPTVKCVGLIESFRYSGDDDAPIRIRALVSKDTAANVRAKLASPVTATTLQLSWYIVSFDEDRKQWFEAAFVKNGARAQAAVDVMQGTLQLFIDSKAIPVGEHLDIGVYRLEFQVVPTEGPGSLLEFATGPTQRLVKKWAADD
ncbi:MAG TPA: hypothetical protein VFQ35_18095 [Polyangiaceae bacterium]|nr:hypothetical protein [Polyangiaceae bacterium]